MTRSTKDWKRSICKLLFEVWEKRPYCERLGAPETYVERTTEIFMKLSLINLQKAHYIINRNVEDLPDAVATRSE